MNARLIHVSTAFAALFAAATVHAEYKCDDPSWQVDRRACAAAKEGPRALNRFVWRMRPFASLYFPDYVNQETLAQWDARSAKEARERADADALANDQVAHRSDSISAK